MPSFLAGSFAVAGVIAAVGPVVIHLLNRRRYRVIKWGAMDLLREALARNRRLLRLRDLVLLALRTAAVLLFGLALSRPFFTSAAGSTDPRQPVHAVMIVDNSLSMGYEQLSGTVLDEARARAIEFIERLPSGSRISVLPLCGSPAGMSADAHRTVADARDALARIEVLDRSGTATQAADLALEACGREPDLPAKRVVFISDQQLGNWPAGVGSDSFGRLPDFQIVRVGGGNLENAWIDDFRILDGVADVETPTLFLVTIRYDGPTPRNNVEVTLTIDGAAVATQSVDLEPGQSRHVRFTHQFDLPVEPGEPTYVSAEVSLTPDRLRGDDTRYLAVPVVAALPVVFVDQWGAAGEDLSRNRIGETYSFRRLLVPRLSGGEFSRQLIVIRHVTIDRLEKQVLQDARLVVVAGIDHPGSQVELLREYAEQGGRVIVAAGGDFDPESWTRAGWLDGGGILPLPLAPRPIGRLPDAADSRLEPFFLAPESMTGEYFTVEDSDPEELADLYRTPLFFKAVVADAGDDTISALEIADIERIIRERERQAADADEAESGQGNASSAESAAGRFTLGWRDGRPDRDREMDPQALARQWRPRVLARFSNGLPFLVERQIRRGKLLFVATGLQSAWNNLSRTNAVMIYDRIMRSLLAETLPQRNLGTREPIVIPVAAGDRRGEFTLEEPADGRRTLFVDALGPDRFGINLASLAVRGHYRVVARRPDGELLWKVPLAVNGPAAESELQPIDPITLDERLGSAGYRQIERGESIRVEGSHTSGQDMWKWLLALVLVVLLAEFGVLAGMQKTGKPDFAADKPGSN